MRTRLLLFLFIWIGLLSCKTSPIEGLWVGSHSVSFNGDTMSIISAILDFDSSDSVFVQSFSYDNVYQKNIHYIIKNDTLNIDNGDLIYKFYKKNNNLHLIDLKNETDTSSKKDYRIKENIYKRPPKVSITFPAGFIHGPYLMKNTFADRDTLEFINDSIYLTRNGYGYKDFHYWKLHKERGLQFIELWEEYSMGNPILLFPTHISKESFTVCTNFDNSITGTFTPIKYNIKKTDITGQWTEDSLIQIFDPYGIADTTIYKTNLNYKIKQDSIIREKRSSLKYFSDFTGKELIASTNAHFDDGEEYTEYYHYKIINYSDDSMILSMIPRWGKALNNIYYLTRNQTITK